MDPDEWFPVASQRQDVEVPSQRESAAETAEVAYVVRGPGHSQEFHARQSRRPNYTWEQYTQDVGARRNRRYEVVEVSSLDAPEAWL